MEDFLPTSHADEPSADLELFLEDLGAEELPGADSLATWASLGSASCPYSTLSTASCASSS